MKIVVSIPVHENMEVILNQIDNFQKFIPNVFIVLHISEKLSARTRLEKIIREHYKRVLINPRCVETAWGNIIYAHIDNFRYACTQMEFEYFVMHASNDMYIRYGFDDYIKKFDAGFTFRKVENGHSMWWPANEAQKDEQILFLQKMSKTDSIMATQVESSFYKREIMEKIIQAIDESEKYKNESIIYPREEFYFSTAAMGLVDAEKVGYVTTFSEVHRFDRIIWKIRRMTQFIYNKTFLHRVIPIRKYYQIENIYTEWLFKTHFNATTPRIVKKLLRNDKKYLYKNSFLDDGYGTFRFYGNEIFSVKRVPRDLNNSLRKYINNHL